MFGKYQMEINSWPLSVRKLKSSNRHTIKIKSKKKTTIE